MTGLGRPAEAWVVAAEWGRERPEAEVHMNVKHSAAKTEQPNGALLFEQPNGTLLLSLEHVSAASTS